MNSKGIRRKSKSELFQTHRALEETSPDPIVIKTITDLINKNEITRAQPKLHQFYINGLIDGDGTFNITFKSSLKIQPTFAVGMCKDSINILNYLQQLIGAGNVYRVNDQFFRYQIQNVRDIHSKLLPLFNNKSFMTHKKEHYKVFVKIVNLCQSREAQKKEKL